MNRAMIFIGVVGALGLMAGCSGAPKPAHPIGSGWKASLAKRYGLAPDPDKPGSFVVVSKQETTRSHGDKDRSAARRAPVSDLALSQSH